MSRSAWFTAAAVTAVVGVYVIACWIAGVDIDTRERDGLILLFFVLAAAVAALVGWHRQRAAADTAIRRLHEERAAAEQAAREFHDVAAVRERALMRERDRLRNQLSREHAGVERMERQRAAERTWGATLRGEVERMHRERGGEGDLDGVREVVLRVATELLEARRGLLLTRRPGDHAAVLHLVASRGFANDPAGSRLVARFAREVLEPGTTLRQQRDGPDAGDTAADAEVSTLVAIPLYVRDHFQGILVCADRRGGFGREDDEVLLALGDHVASILHTERLQAELRESYAGTVQLLAEAIDARDPRLHGHAQEVARYAEAIGRRLEVEPDERRLLSIASLLHDVGTVAVSERVLLKPGPLNEQEREVIELHPRIGAQVVSQVPALRPLAPAILHHHERFDGTGYPGRLAGEDIPAPARLIAVAEAFSAMTQDRPHRGRRSVDEACAVLEAGAGTQFDPEMVRLLVEEVRADPDLVPSAHRAGEEADVIPLLGAGVGALTDNLTLLSSHRAFRDAVDQASRTAAMTGVPFAVALVRLLDLPVVNRRDGYAAGDELIRAAAAALDRFAVRVRGVSGRDGGSRLGLLVPRTDEAAARHLAVQLGAELRAARAVRIATAVWRPGDSGEALARRALRQLAQPRAA